MMSICILCNNNINTIKPSTMKQYRCVNCKWEYCDATQATPEMHYLCKHNVLMGTRPIYSEYKI